MQIGEHLLASDRFMKIFHKKAIQMEQINHKMFAVKRIKEPLAQSNKSSDRFALLPQSWECVLRTTLFNGCQANLIVLHISHRCLFGGFVGHTGPTIERHCRCVHLMKSTRLKMVSSRPCAHQQTAGRPLNF